MEEAPDGRDRRLTAINGAMALIVILLVVQVWLLSATLDAFLVGHRDAAVPAAIVSGLLFLGCAGLYRFAAGLESHSTVITSSSSPAIIPRSLQSEVRSAEKPPPPQSSAFPNSAGSDKRQ